MGIATYETPEGNKTFEIEGETPTAEERFSIESFLSGGSSPRRMSRREQTDQILARYRGGGGQTPGQPAFTPTNQDAEVGKLDRYALGKAEDVDTARGNEKEAALTRLYGQDSWGKAEDGKYYLKLDNIAPEIKQKKGLPETGTMYVNKPGGGFLGLFNMPDVFDFMGAYRGELIGGTIAASAAVTGGLSLIPASLVIGAAAGAGKAVDELQELAQGRQLQSKEQIIGDIATAAAWNAGGNVLGGGIARLAGRVIKGPGVPDSKVITDLIAQGLSPSQATAAAVQMQRTTIRREIGPMLERGGAAPTISESTGKSILGRMQGIHEAIFPNRKAARLNREHVQKLLAEFQEGVLSEADLTTRLNANARRINEYVDGLKANPETAVKQVETELNKVIRQEMENIKDVWTPEGELSVDIQDALKRSVRLWNRNNRVLYQHAEDGFAPYMKRVDTSTGENLPGVKPERNISTLFSGKDLNRFMDEMLKEFPVNAPALRQDPNFKYIASKKGENYTFSELQQLRTSLRESYASDLVVPISSAQFNALTKHIDEIFKTTQLEIQQIVKELGEVKLNSSYGESGIPKGLWPEGAGAATPITATAKKTILENAKKGFDSFEAAQTHYKDGAELFKSTAIEMINKNISEGFAPDLMTVAKMVIQDGKPQILRNFLKAVTPEKPQKNLINKVTAPEWTNLAKLARDGNITELNTILDTKFPNLTAPGRKKIGMAFKPPSFLEEMAPTDPYRIRVLKDLAETFDQHAGDVTAGAAPTAERNINKGMLAKRWMQEAVKDSGIDWDLAAKDPVGYARQLGTFSPTKLNQAFTKLGAEVQETLFGKEYALSLRNTLRDLTLTSSDPKNASKILAETMDLSSITNKDMKGLAETFRKTLDDFEVQSKSALFKAVDDKIIDDPETIILAASKDRKLTEELLKSVGEGQLEAAGGLKDATMALLMRRAFPETQGVVTEAATISGAWSKNLKDAIKDMNKSGYIDKVLGKDTVTNIIKVADLPLSDASIKGIGGIVSAAYGAGLGMAILANPVAGLAGVAGVYLSGRVLRSKSFLRLLTRPNISTAKYRAGVKGLADDILNKNKLARDLDSSVKTINRNEATAMAKQQLGGDEAAFKRMISEIVATEARVIASVMGSGLTGPQTRQDIGQGISAASDVVRPIAQEVAAAAGPVVGNLESELRQVAQAEPPISPIRQLEVEKLQGTDN